MEFEEHNDYDYLLKVILIGDSGVGKSCLLKSYMTHRWDEIYTSTIGVDFEIKCVELLGHKVNLQIWDTAGQERFRTITTSYYRVSDVVVMVFDLADSRSFENVKNWMADVKTYAHESVDIMLVGNKVDLESRQITFDQAVNFARENGVEYIEASAKTGFNVEEAFANISTIALEHKIASGKGKRAKEAARAVDIRGATDSSSSGCC